MKKAFIISALVCALFVTLVSCENSYVQDMLTGPATLDSLALQANGQTYDLRPYFSSEVYNYTATVPFMTEEIVIGGLAHKDGTARYSAGDGSAFGEEGGPRTFPFPQEKDEIYIRIRVTRPYMDAQTYLLHVVRGADSLLGNIEVHSGVNDDMTSINSRRALSPGFDPERFGYFARVLPSARALRIAGLINPAKVHIYFRKDGAAYPAAPDSAVKEYSFPEAEEMTVIRIKVVPYEGSVEDTSLAKEYMVTVSRNNIVYLDPQTLIDYPAIGETFGISGGEEKTGGRAFGPGEPVVFDLPAPFGYLSGNAVISYIPEGRNPVVLPVSPNGKYLFIMPDVNVRIKAVFEEIPAATYTNVRYVYERGYAGADGRNWAHATRDLQWLIDNFNKDNTPDTDDDYEIWIARGTIRPTWAWARLDPSDPLYPDPSDLWYPLPDPQYRPEWAEDVQPAQRTMDNWCIVLKNGIKIYGGFAGTEVHEADKNNRDIRANETRLSGEMPENGKTRHLLVAVGINAPTVVDGITVMDSIAGGRADPLQINKVYLGDGYTINSIWYGAGLHNINCTRDLLYSRVTVTACWTMYGGGVYNRSASPVFQNCTIIANSTDSYGGGILNVVNSAPLFKDCFIESNQAKTNGGGIYNVSNSTPEFENCRIRGNQSANGGAIYNTAASPVFRNSEIISNIATGTGGAVYNAANSQPRFENCHIQSNRAGSQGGAIYNTASSPVFVDSEILANSANMGGGVYNAASSSPRFERSLIEANTVPNTGANVGGGIYNNASVPVLTNTRVVNNTGHGIYGTGNNSLYMEGGEVSGNANTGIYLTGTYNAVLTNVRVRGNLTPAVATTGGGIYFSGSAAASILALTNVEITGNRATGNGGGLYVNTNGSIQLTNVTIAHNYSGGTGGGIFFNSSVACALTSKINNAIIWGNSAATPGTDNGNIGGTNRPATFAWSLAEGYNLSAAGTNANGYDGTDPANAPLFVSAPTEAPTEANTPYLGGDFRLVTGSPGIDAGDNTVYGAVYNALSCAPAIGQAAPAAGAISSTPGPVAGPAKDWSGADRPQGAAIDMGAYETE
ncbi:MAG: right-handed parallel beta-helix repeat-containing protein [Treponema sp.]|jgi:hypothetical protein|nr:right-handed parallel beta-helix repeat-containing protein [Treponema sp.]